jgi:cell division protein FtsW (lipid II flippase)
MPQIVWTVLIVVLLLAVFGGLPSTGWHSYGWYPSGGAGLLLLILILIIVFR